MRKQVFIHVSKNRITNRQVIAKAFDELKETDGCTRLTFEAANKRSNPQNRFLHGVVFPIVCDGLRAAGFDEIKTPEDAKAVVKELFLKELFANHKTGECLTRTKKTSELTTIEMMQFIEDVQKWSAEYLGCVIPDPNQQLELI